MALSGVQPERTTNAPAGRSSTGIEYSDPRLTAVVCVSVCVPRVYTLCMNYMLHDAVDHEAAICYLCLGQVRLLRLPRVVIFISDLLSEA